MRRDSSRVEGEFIFMYIFPNSTLSSAGPFLLCLVLVVATAGRTVGIQQNSEKSCNEGFVSRVYIELPDTPSASLTELLPVPLSLCSRGVSDSCRPVPVCPGVPPVRPADLPTEQVPRPRPQPSEGGRD